MLRKGYGVGVTTLARHRALHAPSAPMQAGAQNTAKGPQEAKQVASTAVHAAMQAAASTGPPSTGLTQESWVKRIIRIITRALAFCPFIVVVVFVVVAVAAAAVSVVTPAAVVVYVVAVVVVFVIAVTLVLYLPIFYGCLCCC